jgi:hypothetical protein
VNDRWTFVRKCLYHEFRVSRNVVHKVIPFEASSLRLTLLLSLKLWRQGDEFTESSPSRIPSNRAIGRVRKVNS